MAKAKKVKEEPEVIIEGEIIDLPLENSEVEITITDSAETDKPESDEIVFLRHILHIEHTGGWGRHLDDIINERINKLKG